MVILWHKYESENAAISELSVKILHYADVQRIFQTIHLAEIISANPSTYIKVPKKAPTNVIKRYIVSHEKLLELLEKYPFGSSYYIPILVLYHTGMRISEVLSINLYSRQGYFYSTLKTQSSSRKILIDDVYRKLSGSRKNWQKLRKTHRRGKCLWLE